jgi:hypothetical protein
MGIFQRIRGGTNAGRGDAPYPMSQTGGMEGPPSRPPVRMGTMTEPLQPPRPRRDTWNVAGYSGKESTPLRDLNEATYKIAPSVLTRGGVFKPQPSGSDVGGYSTYDSHEDRRISKGLEEHTRGLSDSEKVMRYSTDPRARQQHEAMARFHKVQIAHHQARAQEMGSLKNNAMSKPPQPPKR